jgi:hypothetical protein
VVQIRRGTASGASEAAVAAELASQIADPEAVFVLAFASATFDPPRMAAALARAFAPVPVFGCTSIGEIGDRGFGCQSVVGVSLSSPGTRLGAACPRHISRNALSGGHQAVLAAAAVLGRRIDELSPKRHVGLCLIDWRSQVEELFIAGAGATAPSISFVGGSASDGIAAEQRSSVFFDGEAVRDAAIVVLLETDVPFRLLVSEHMVPRSERVVVTETEPGTRLVREMDGWPAADRYREVLGLKGELTDQVVAQYPFGYYVDGRPYVRSVMGVEGTSLRFACGVDRGTVLVPMQPGDIITATRNSLASTAQELGGDIASLIAFSCYGRFVEAENKALSAPLANLLCEYRSVGFHTFGEQVNTLHVNHTLTGLAFGTTRG